MICGINTVDLVKKQTQQLLFCALTKCNTAVSVKVLSAGGVLVFVSENGLTYSITSGNVGSAFEVVPDLGEVKVRCHLDYETGPRVYQYSVSFDAVR